MHNATLRNTQRREDTHGQQERKQKDSCHRPRKMRI